MSRYLRRHGAVLALVAAAASAPPLLAAAPAASTDVRGPTPVATSRDDEGSPHAYGAGVVWTQRQPEDEAGRRAAVYVYRGDEAPAAVTDPTGIATGVGLFGSTVVYAIGDGQSRRLERYDLRTGARTPVAAPSAASFSGTHVWYQWVLYRQIGRCAENRVVLYNTETREQRDVGGFASCSAGIVELGGLSGPYASWIECERETSCKLVRYDIRTRRSASPPRGALAARMIDAPSVTADGTVYFAAGGARSCTGVTSIFRWNGRTRIERLLDVGRRTEVRSASATLYGRSTRVYYEVRRCGAPASDIYRFDGPRGWST